MYPKNKVVVFCFAFFVFRVGQTSEPLWLIKNYFGVKIGLYFAWLAFYSKMLIFPSIMGIICFIFGAATIHSIKLGIHHSAHSGKNQHF